MIRQTAAWIVVGACVVGLTAGALAQAPATPAQAPAAPATPANPAAPAARMPAKPGPRPTMKSAAGTIKSSTADSLHLVVKVKNGPSKEMAFALDKNTRFIKAGKPIAAKDITDTDTVVVNFTEAEGKMLAKRVMVRVPRSQAAKTPVVGDSGLPSSPPPGPASNPPTTKTP